MPELKCPVCGEVLTGTEHVMRCRNGHSFDIAKQGYVNLLMSNSSSGKRHGDDKAMVLARCEFLNKGYYDCLRDELCALAVKHCGGIGGSINVLDAGCGEGWYTCAVKSALESAGESCSVCGVDISKHAMIQAAKRAGGLTLAVGSVSALPVPDGSCDLLLNVFAPNDDREFFRVLRPGGIFIKAVPCQDHLMELKSAIYDRPYRNPAPDYSPEGFRQVSFTRVRKTVSLRSSEDIMRLFMMTPYYYKTGREDQEKLSGLRQLDTCADFGVYVFERM